MYRHLRDINNDAGLLDPGPTDEQPTDRSGKDQSFSKYSTISPRQKTQARTTKRAWVRVRAFGWWWEVGAIFVALVCTGLTIAILCYMDRKSLAAWKLPIQPNSLVAVFSAIAKAALLVPIAEGLSQLKWMYLDASEPRRLGQIQAFDEASRGPWGAATLFWKTRRGPRPILAWLGCAVTILLLAFEPFAQQVIEFSTRSAAMANATGSAVAVHNLQDGDPGISSSNATLPFVLGVNGLIAGRPEMLLDEATCPTDECHLPDYESLAACALCEAQDIDIASMASLDCSFGLTLAYGVNYTNVESYKNLSRVEFSDHMENYTATVPAQVREYPGSVYYTIGCPIRRAGHLSATLFVLKNHDMLRAGIDVNEYYDDANSSIANFGVWDYSYQASSPAYSKDFPLNGCAGISPLPDIDVDYWPAELIPYVPTIAPFTCVEAVSDLTKALDDVLNNMEFRMHWCNMTFCAQQYENVTIRNGKMEAENTVSKPLELVEELLDEGNSTGDYSLRIKGQDSPSYTIGNVTQGIYFDLVSSFLFNQKPGGFDKYFNDVGGGAYPKAFEMFATVSTNLIQTRANPDNDLIYGHAYGHETYVRVNWAWFAMPLALIFLSILFLLLTALQSAGKSYLFKTSLLAVLFHGLEDLDTGSLVGKEEHGGGAGFRETRRDLIEKAERCKVRLGRNKDGHLKIVKVE